VPFVVRELPAVVQVRLAIAQVAGRARSAAVLAPVWVRLQPELQQLLAGSR